MTQEEYRKGGEAVRTAWFAYHAQRAATKPTSGVITFVAGWNACLAHLEAQKAIEAKRDGK